MDIPKRCDVVVIGGGPAGSSAASGLVREGLEVVLLDKAKHPRPEVGESLIPHFWKYAKALGVDEAIEAEGFAAKAGGIVSWGGQVRQVRFSDFGYTKRGGLHVERDRFDHILLQHAARSGAQVFEEVGVRSVALGRTPGPTVTYEDRRGGRPEPGSIECKYVVDASGHCTLLASQLGARRLVGSKGRYLGIWGYYEGASFIGADQKVHAADQLRAVKPMTLVCSYEDGWAWHIILRECTSVGLVINTDRIRGLGKAERERYFVETCASIPQLAELLAPARFIEGSLCFRPDYSYYSERVVGDDFFCVGDAATFIDPIFSQGVTTGFYNSAVATWAISISLKNPSRKEFYAELYRRKLMEHYGFYRLLAFGDFGGEGIDPELVRVLILSLPQSELELSLVASAVTERAQYFHEMARQAGLGDRLSEDVVARLALPVPSLAP